MDTLTNINFFSSELNWMTCDSVIQNPAVWKTFGKDPFCCRALFSLQRASLDLEKLSIPSRTEHPLCNID